MRRVRMVQEHALFHFRGVPNNATVAHDDVAADTFTAAAQIHDLMSLGKYRERTGPRGSCIRA
jgi:hypothetical protein